MQIALLKGFILQRVFSLLSYLCLFFCYLEVSAQQHVQYCCVSYYITAKVFRFRLHPQEARAFPIQSFFLLPHLKKICVATKPLKLTKTMFCMHASV